MGALMKGKVWAEHKHKLVYPVYVEDKTDEIRCHVIVDADSGHVEFLSYAGKPLANLRQFADRFFLLTQTTGYKEFDCGVEVNGNYNDSYRWVRSTKAAPEDLDGKPILFYMFDLPEHKGSYEHRAAARERLVRHAHESLGLPVVEPWMTRAASEAEVDAYFLARRAEGKEGLMVKTGAHLYLRGKRIDGWLKMKPEADADGIIVGFNEAISLEGKPLGRVGSLVVEMAEDDSVAQPAGIAHDLGRDMWLNQAKYLNQWCEFKYMERDRQGGYRHPVFHRLREAKA